MRGARQWASRLPTPTRQMGRHPVCFRHHRAEEHRQWPFFASPKSTHASRSGRYGWVAQRLADQGLVADESEGQADQDRREGSEPRPLCYLPDGRGRHRTANVPRDFAAHRGATAATTTSASVRRSTVMRSRATDRRSASKCQGDGQIRPSTKHSGCPRVPVGVRTSRLSCKRAGKTRSLLPVWDSSGESRLIPVMLYLCFGPIAVRFV